MYGDKEFRRYYIQTWGVDLLGEQTREKALFAGLDDFYYLPSNPPYNANNRVQNKHYRI